MKKRSLLFTMFIVLMTFSILITGCSSRKAAESMPAQQPVMDQSIEKGAAPGAPSTTAQTSNRKLVVKLYMDMRVDDIEKSILEVEAMAATAGGYTRESYQNEFSGQLTLMIPAGKVDTFTKNLKSLGKIMNSNRNTEDVTDSYFDTQIRIKNLEAEIDTMRNLLQKPGWKVSEILEIEKEIRRLTDELETLKGYITNLDRQISYSEIRISFQKSEIAINSDNQDSLGYKLQLALKNGVDLLINIFTSILTLIAFILPISPIFIIAYFMLRKPLRRFSRKNEHGPDDKQ